MSNPLPDLLALTSIADGSKQQAAPVRNNFSAIQTAVNALRTALAGGAAGQVLTASDAADLAWGAKTTVSSLAGGPPASPADGDIWIATGVDGNGTRWQFQYNAGSASAYKWEFIGGAPAFASGTSPTVGIALARAGDYVIRWTADCTAATTFWQDILTATSGVLVGGAGQMTDSVNGQRDTLTGVARVLGCSAATNVAHNISGYASIVQAILDVIPVRIA